MSQNQWATYSGQQLAASFAQEADAFGAIAMSPGFENLLTQYHDYDSFLKTLNNDQYKKLGVNALEFSKNFNWDKIVKKYIELI